MNTDGMEVLREHALNTLLSFPMWMRFNYCLNMIGKILSKHDDESSINWDKVNEILNTNRDPYDFSYFKRIETADELSYATMMCHQGSIIGGVWQEHTCKDCGKDFIMGYHEVQFYKKKELPLPRRCKACRAKRKAGKLNENS